MLLVAPQLIRGPKSPPTQVYSQAAKQVGPETWNRISKIDVEVWWQIRQMINPISALVHPSAHLVR